MFEDDCNTSKEDLMDLFPNASEGDMQTLAEVINDYGADFGINNVDKLRHFLAQTGHETGGYTTLNVTESTYWTTASRLAGIYDRFTMDSIAAVNDPDLYYAPDYLQNSEGVANVAMCCRMCNGDVASGDGYRYRGRGIVQLTGKCNYTDFQDWYNAEYDPDIDVLSNPDSVATDTNLSILSGLWFFKDRVLDKLEDDEMSVFNVSRMINNPRAKENDDVNGFDDRSNRYDSATEIINCN